MVPPTLVEYCYTGVVRHKKFVTATDAWKNNSNVGRKKRNFLRGKKRFFHHQSKKSSLTPLFFNHRSYHCSKKFSIIWTLSRFTQLGSNLSFQKKVLFTTENTVLEGENTMFFISYICSIRLTIVSVCLYIWCYYCHEHLTFTNFRTIHTSQIKIHPVR